MPRMTIRRMPIACWITEATDTHSEYLIFIAFPRRQWLHERASMLLYVHCVSCSVLTLSVLCAAWKYVRSRDFV
jgi:hypothetical protein